MKTKLFKKTPRYLCLNWTESLCTGQSLFFFLHNRRLSCQIYQLAVANLRGTLHRLHRPAVIYFASDGAARWCSTLDRNPFGDTFYRNRIWATFTREAPVQGVRKKCCTCPLHASLWWNHPVQTRWIWWELNWRASSSAFLMELRARRIWGGKKPLDWLGLSWVRTRSFSSSLLSGQEISRALSFIQRGDLPPDAHLL